MNTNHSEKVKTILQKTILSGMACQINNIWSLFNAGSFQDANKFLLNLREQIEEMIDEAK